MDFRHVTPAPLAAASGYMGPKLLIAEDEPKLAALLQEYFSAAAYRVSCVYDGSEVLPRFHKEAPAAVLLDLMLPGRDGLDICRELRAFSDVPILILTARVEEVDRLIGLEIGADDYICKPFSPMEAVARLRAVMRRTNRGLEALFRGLVIDAAQQQASLDGRSLVLTRVEFRLLKTLASAPGRVFSRAQLRRDLYADHRVVAERTIDSHIKNLRRKLQSVRPLLEPIESVYGQGYKLRI
jgi:two-component system, OmpR family, response regulator BaeR